MGLIRRRSSAEVAIVAEDLPLLSNLSVLQNVALIPQYHQGLKTKPAHQMVRELLAQAQLDHLADMRACHLTEQDVFWVKILRAAVRQAQTLLIDRPFLQSHGALDFGQLLDLLDLLARFYDSCQIFEYARHQNMYQTDRQNVRRLDPDALTN